MFFFMISESRDHATKGGIPKPFTKAIDRALHLPGSTVQPSHGVPVDSQK
jgi:hypothetical protein